METEWSTFRSHLKELSDYIDPRRGRFFITDRNQGERRHNLIINSRGSQALRTAQSGLFAGIMSPSKPWFALEALDPDLMRSQAVKEWLHLVEEIIRSIFLESNLYNQAPVMLGEAIQFGTGAMSQLEDFENVARFYSHTVGSYFIAQNDRYEVDTYASRREISVKQMVQMFGKENCSRAVQQAYDRGDYEQWYPVYQFIEPNKNFDPEKKDSKPFVSVWFEPGEHGATSTHDLSNNRFLRKKGFDEFPVHVIRWATTGEDVYGTSCPGMVALGDIKGLQIMEKRKAQAIDKLVNPPLKGPPSLRDVPISSLPGGVNIYDSTGEKEGLTALYQVDPRLNEMRVDMAAQEQRINEAFFVDLFLAISTMEGIQPKNELELSQRNSERLLMLGPPLQRLQLEFLSKLINRTFNQAVRADILPEPPEELSGQTLSVRYVSSLAMAQRSVEVAALERSAIFAGQLAGIKEEVLDKLDVDELYDQYTTLIGAIPSIIVPDEEVAAKRQQRLELQQRAALAQIEGDEAGAAKDRGSAVKDISDAVSE